jgi:hypothetical protein
MQDKAIRAIKLHSPTDAGQSNACQSHTRHFFKKLHHMQGKAMRADITRTQQMQDKGMRANHMNPAYLPPPPQKKIVQILTQRQNNTHTHTHTPSTQNCVRISWMCLPPQTLPGLPNKGVLRVEHHLYPWALAIDLRDFCHPIQSQTYILSLNAVNDTIFPQKLMNNVPHTPLNLFII